MANLSTTMFTVALTIDADAWRENYGVDDVNHDVAHYFRKWLTSAVRDHIDATGNAGSVIVQVNE